MAKTSYLEKVLLTIHCYHIDISCCLLLWWFEWQWPLKGYVFEFLVSTWWSCLGMIKRWDLIDRYMSLRAHFKVLNAHFISIPLSLSALQLWIRWMESTIPSVQCLPAGRPPRFLTWWSWTLTIWNHDPQIIFFLEASLVRVSRKVTKT